MKMMVCLVLSIETGLMFECVRAATSKSPNHVKVSVFLKNDVVGWLHH